MNLKFEVLNTVNKKNEALTWHKGVLVKWMLNFISLRFSSKYDSYNRSILLSYTIHVWLSSLQVTVTCKPLRSGLKIFKETCWGTTFGDRNSWITWWWETKNSLKQRHSTRDLPFSTKLLPSFYMTLYTLTSVCIFSILSNILFQG